MKCLQLLGLASSQRRLEKCIGSSDHFLASSRSLSVSETITKWRRSKAGENIAEVRTRRVAKSAPIAVVEIKDVFHSACWGLEAAEKCGTFFVRA